MHFAFLFILVLLVWLIWMEMTGNNCRSDFLCTDCGKEFKRRHGLVAHKAHHCPHAENKRGLYVCPICGKALWQKSRLEQHILTVHRQFTTREFALSMPNTSELGSFDCPDCGRNFKRRQNLKWHRTHHCRVSGPKPGRCVCQHCGKILWQKSRLEKHVAEFHSSSDPTSTSSSSSNHFETVLDLSGQGATVTL